jgi:hypothetical protein
MRISDGDGNPFDAPHPAASSDLGWSRTQASILMACTRLARENQPSRRPSKIQPFPGLLQKNFKWVVTYHENGVHVNNNVLTHLRENYRRRGQDLKRNKDGTYRVVERNVIGTGKVLIPHNDGENRPTLTDNRQRRSGMRKDEQELP